MIFQEAREEPVAFITGIARKIQAAQIEQGQAAGLLEQAYGSVGKGQHVVQVTDTLAVSDSIKAEEKMTSRFYVLDTEGKLTEFDDFSFTGHDNLKRLATYEKKKVRAYEKELADSSQVGRWLRPWWLWPRGRT